MKNKKVLSVLMLSLLACSNISIAQEANANPFAPDNQKKSIAKTDTKESKPVDKEINYNKDTSNLDGNKTVAIPSDPNKGQQLPNPSVQNALPTQLPSGLPENYQTIGQQTSPLEATINMLNTPNSRIREINQDLYSKGKVINESPVTPPKSINSVLVAHLSPGSTSPVIRVSKNRTTAIIITDISGQPWPIINYDGLSEQDFTVKRLDNPAPDGYVLSITPKGTFVTGNLTLILKGLPSPLSIDFVSAQKEVDAKTEIRVQGKGPNTQYSSVGLPASLDNNLLSILQGVPPTGSKELKVSTQAVQAWLDLDGSMYVRTRYKIMAPAFEQVSTSPDGTYAYKMVAVPVVLYKTGDAQFGEFNIEGL